MSNRRGWAAQREANGWRTISFEEGPDNDIDAVFAQRDGSIETFCNLGKPTISEVKRSTLNNRD